MLVLTAKRDDRIKIGDNIEVLIIYTADSRVRIGIEAPKDLRIERKPKQKETETKEVPESAGNTVVSDTASGRPEPSAPTAPAAANGSSPHAASAPRLRRTTDSGSD